MLSELQALCRDYLFEDKYLVGPSFLAGYEVCQALARRAGSVINLRPTTVQGIAQGIAALEMARKQITFLNAYLAQQVVEGLVQELDAQGRLQYFRRRHLRPGLVNALSSAIFEVRNCGITAADLTRDMFAAADKGDEFIALLKAYEDYLAAHSCIDGPGLVKLAVNIMKRGSSPGIYIIPGFLELSLLEKQLFHELGKGPGRVVYLDPLPARLSTQPSCDCELLARINRDTYPPPFNDGTVEMFHAYGLTNEVREVLRRIHRDEIPLDQVTVAVSSDEYRGAFLNLSRELGFGITIMEGIPASFTRPGRALQGLVKWVREEFSAASLLSWLKDSRLLLKGAAGESLTPSEVEELLLRARVGWGRSRYRRLEVLARGAAGDRDAGDHNAHPGSGGDTQVVKARFLHDILSEFFAALPEMDSGMVSLKELAEGLALILQKVEPAQDELEQEALGLLLRRLKETSLMNQIRLPLEEALHRIEALTYYLRVGGSGSLPGHLHLVGYRNLIWSDRPCTFVVGLDAGSFPGRALQDPIVLDSERFQISAGLPPAARGPQALEMLMEVGLSTRRGRVFFSCSSFDPVQARELFPSSIMLKVYRLLKGDHSLDYSHLQAALDPPVGFLPAADGMPLTEDEWWLKAALTYGQRLRVLAGDAFRAIRQGEAAETHRRQGRFTQYDGMIEVSGEELDPRFNGRVLSCSAIEQLATCPFAYFMKYVLQVLPPEKLEYDVERWLPPHERGSLLHELYRRFLQYLGDRNETVDFQQHHHVIREMAHELIEAYAQRIPPPSELVFQAEADEIYRAGDLFLKGHEAFTGYRPLMFEVPFGMGPRAVEKAGYGLVDPVRVELENGASFLLQGVIDRVDRGADGGFVVWDYKTGSAYGYQEHGYLKRGRQVQHALYAVAAEEILRQMGEQEPRVVMAGYYFPTERGEGRRILRRQDMRSLVRETLGYLFDLLREGVFLPAEDGETCSFCDYKEVCDYKRAVARTLEVLKTSPDDYLVPWRRLMMIE